MNYKKFLRAASAALMIVIVVTLVLASGAWAQTKFKTLYKFKGGKNGNTPTYGSMAFDQAGNLYGTTLWGGTYRHGVVFELTANVDGSWTEKALKSFCGSDPCPDGSGLWFSDLIFDQAGNLYSTTETGGTWGAGTVFELTPNADGSWTESVLYSFTGGTDGGLPEAGVIFDTAGNLYGTTAGGGAYEAGTAFTLTPNVDGSWTESVLYNFAGANSGGVNPRAGLTIDEAGNLYGTTFVGGNHKYCNGQGCGVVFKLAHNTNGSWTETVLHAFTNGKDGGFPAVDPLTLDQTGNLYGTTPQGGNICYDGNGCGVVFKLTPNADGSWTEKVLHDFTGRDGFTPEGRLSLDKAGNVYGTTLQGGSCPQFGCGVVYRLIPNSDGTWKENVLHHFAGGISGSDPPSGVIFDNAGNLYGTTEGGGNLSCHCGLVFRLTPTSHGKQ